MKPLRAILFDIDNTLFATSEFATQARLKGIEAMCDLGLRGDPSELMTQLKEVVAEFGSNDRAHYAKFLKRLPREALGGWDPLLLEATGVVGYSQTKFRKYVPHEDVLSVLAELAKTPLILGVMTNGLAIKQAEKLVRLGVLPFMHPRAIFISEAVGVAKPNPRAFLNACERFDLDPSMVMMVGDHPVNDIAPPLELGMTAVQNCRNIKAEFKHPDANYHIENFWDLLDLVNRDFEFGNL